MSLLYTVTQMVLARGRATVDDLMPELPGVTRTQAIKALQNARRKKLVSSTGQHFGGRQGALPTTYTAYVEPEPVAEVVRKRVNSVWGLAA
jgi:hypothetical protein